MHRIITWYVWVLTNIQQICFDLASKTGYCYICKSYPGYPTDFKKFCSRCGREP